jgi:hypothetical protein
MSRSNRLRPRRGHPHPRTSAEVLQLAEGWELIEANSPVIPSSGVPVRAAADRNEELLCGICLEFMIDPVRTSCTHRFCRGCLASWYSQQGSPSCPLCRSTQTFEPVPDESLAKSINGLIMRCPLCFLTMPRQEALRHKSRCAVGNLPCSCPMCDSKRMPTSLPNALPPGAPSGLNQFVVVSRPRGADFFFVRPQGEYFIDANLFVHQATFTAIIEGSRRYWTCSDSSPILMPRVGELMVGVIPNSSSYSQQRVRIDRDASVAKFEKEKAN